MPKFIETLPENLQGEAALQNFESAEQLATSYLEAKRFQGQAIRIPGEDAGKEDWEGFNSKLIEKVPGLMPKPDFSDPDATATFFRSIGAPAEVDGYQMPEVKDLPEGYQIDEATVKAIREMAHESKLTQKQFDTMATKLIKQSAAKFTNATQSEQQNNEALRENWGEAYNQNLKAVSTVMKQLDAPPHLVAQIEKGTADLETMNWALNIHKAIGSEERVPDAGGKVGDTIMTPLDAQLAIDEINNNPDHPYWVGRGDEKKRATERMVQLMKWAYPST